ncbi:MAG: heme exporter protein CcmB, partial [Pseudomonadota bacterium]
LDLLGHTGLPLELVVLAKALAHWLTAILPLILAAPLMGLFLNINSAAIGTTLATLIAGTPAITLIGAVGAALTVGIRRGGVLLAILVMPLVTPVLIFGIGASNAALVGGTPFRMPFLLLCAISLMSVALAPFAAAAALKAGND